MSIQHIYTKNNSRCMVGPNGKPAYGRKLIKVGNVLAPSFTESMGSRPTSDDMAERSTDRRRVPVSLVKLKYMGEA